MPFSFTLLGSGALLVLLGVVVAVNLIKKLTTHHK
jgi:hypothetical protein